MNEKDYSVKTFQIDDFKASEEGGKFYIEGYANTKGKPDTYGDIPMNMNGKPIYDLNRMKSNPVMLVNHQNAPYMIMGTFVKLKEDEKGLYFKALIKNEDQSVMPEVKETIINFKTGFARALSIGGRWQYEDPKNPTHLTKALIHEISGVGVGADGNALSDTVDKPKKAELDNDKAVKPLESLAGLIAEYRKNPSDETLQKIMEAKKNEKENSTVD